MVLRSGVIPALPIDDALPALRAALRAQRMAVLQAPPGAGKTTHVPLALLEEPWLAAGRVVMLEPRRLAARTAARRMATLLGDTVGGVVGLRMRGESRVGARTRIEVVTEGVLTRMLQSDPTLEGVGVVIFDEFHERSLVGDLGLALTLQSRELLRPDLRVLVMSATLDGAAVSGLLDDAPIITSEGRAFPVDVQYLGRRADQRVEAAVSAAIRIALAREDGSVLAFLPGAGEIRRCLDLLQSGELPGSVRLHPLYGDLPADAQDAAIAPAAPNTRKVVLATSIAETSLTIEGVRVIVDSGLSRVPRFSPRTGMTRLETVRVSQASAEQRRGRAGRTSPGTCFRLWAEEEQVGLVPRATPEILDADLASLVLDLASVGIQEPRELRWLDAPPAPALAHARELLVQLDALDASGRITEHGMAVARFGLHPRLAHMLLSAREESLGATACVIAALLEERDVLRRDAGVRDADLRLRVAMVSDRVRTPHHDVDAEAMRRVREQSRRLRVQLGVAADELVDDGASGRLLALAYPERVAQRRGASGVRYLLRSGMGAVLDDAGALTGSAYLTAADLDGRSPDSRIYLAAPLDRADVEREFERQLVREDVIEWDREAGLITTRRRTRLGAIVLSDAPLREVDELEVARVLLGAILRNEGVGLRWSDAATQLRERIAFLHHSDASWPDVSEVELERTAEQWLLPHLIGLRRGSEVEQLDLMATLLDLLTWEQRRELDRLAPTHVLVPSGSHIRIDYADAAAPVLAVRLQELFGLEETPRVGGGAVALTLHLLSPARRPVQVTRDLAGFWRSSYFEVRRELRGRYPKHEWPEDPLTAPPTRRAKPRAR